MIWGLSQQEVACISIQTTLFFGLLTLFALQRFTHFKQMQLRLWIGIPTTVFVLTQKKQNVCVSIILRKKWTVRRFYSITQGVKIAIVLLFPSRQA